jgi:thiol-disulfide isomerase/thioredoxin
MKNLKINTKISDIKYDDNKINIYFFWGDGCPYCDVELEFFESLDEKYFDLFTLNSFEVWYNQGNAKLLSDLANKMEQDVNVVPYTIVGDYSFIGFEKGYETAILDIIKKHHENSYDIYFDK